jgi:hypothetical protein
MLFSDLPGCRRFPLTHRRAFQHTKTIKQRDFYEFLDTLNIFICGVKTDSGTGFVYLSNDSQSRHIVLFGTSRFSMLDKFQKSIQSDLIWCWQPAFWAESLDFLIAKFPCVLWIETFF